MTKVNGNTLAVLAFCTVAACTLQPPERSTGGAGAGGGSSTGGDVFSSAGSSSGHSGSGTGGVGQPVGGRRSDEGPQTETAGGADRAGSSGLAGEPTGGAPDAAPCGSGCGPGATCQGGECVCPEGQALCANVCVDVLSDPRNCGGCGKQCSDDCSAGRCFQTLLQPQGSGDLRPVSLAFGGGHIFYTVGYGIGLRRLPRAGGAPETIATGETGGEAKTVAGNVFWADEGSITNNGKIQRLPLAGGVPVELANMEVAPHELTIGGGYVYWVNHYQGPLMKVPTDGGAKAPATTDAAAIGATNLLNDISGLYWSSERQGGSIFKMSLENGVVSELGSGLGGVFKLGATVLSQGHIYFLHQPSGRDPELAKIATDGGKLTVLLELSGHTIAADSSGVYVGDRAGIWKVGLDGTNLTLLTRDTNVSKLYWDVQDLFWITTDGAIKVTNKNP